MFTWLDILLLAVVPAGMLVLGYALGLRRQRAARAAARASEVRAALDEPLAREAGSVGRRPASPARSEPPHGAH